jgi:hypothetical protein
MNYANMIEEKNLKVSAPLVLHDVAHAVLIKSLARKPL